MMSLSTPKFPNMALNPLKPLAGAHVGLRPSQQLILRADQERLVDELRAALRLHRSVLVQAATGWGKTAIASYIAKETAARQRHIYFNCHRMELVEQTSATWRKYGLDHGFIAAGRPKTTTFANICSIDTLRNRLLTTPEPDICVWDEAHHLGAAGWQLIMDTWKRCKHIGLSATPWRMDGSGLGRQFEVMVQGPSPAWLMENGFLSQYEIFAPDPPDMKGARKDKEGEFTKGDASRRMNMPKRTGDIIKHWRNLANEMRTIAFAVNVPDSQLIVQRFNAAGIPAAHLDADTPKDNRRDIIRDFAAGKILVLSNVALFGEGFDLAAIAQTDVTIDCLIDAAPTQSLSAVLQRWGRVLRPKSYPAIILDHAGNSNTHGYPDDERIWTLGDRERSGKGGASEGAPPPYTCKCFRQVKRPLPDNCPHCGIAIIPDVKPVEEAEGELKKKTAEEKANIKRLRTLEEHNAKTLQELVALANRRGYANPQTWAWKKWSNSKARQQHAHRKTS